MEGGGSGAAIADGDASGSRLYQVMTHAEEPKMPPDQDPLAKEQLEIHEKLMKDLRDRTDVLEAPSDR